jgi:ubiquinone/menaquinone biosynthesis C-methylase UbiE
MTSSENDSKKEIETKEWYDFFGLLSDVVPAIHMGGNQATQDLLEMCQLDESHHVLDVGCGSGHTACEIVLTYGSRVTGIDISEIMIEKAEKRAQKQEVQDKTDFRVADILMLPFDDESFHTVILESVLTPIQGDKAKAINEIIRVLRPGGFFCINESVFVSDIPAEILSLFDQHPAFHGYFTSESLESLLKECGFEILQIIEVKASEAPSAARGMGVRGILSFIFRALPKILGKLLKDSRFRNAKEIDDQITEFMQEHGGYVLIVAEKPKTSTI